MFGDPVGEAAVGAVATLSHISGANLSAHSSVLLTHQDINTNISAGDVRYLD